MKKQFLLVTILILFVGTAIFFLRPDIGTVLQDESLESKIMGKEMRFAVYLPPDYRKEDKLPVLYLLLGFSDDRGSWFKHGDIRKTTSKLIREKQISPAIIVIAESPGAHYLGKFEQYFTEELIPHIESKYGAEKENRAISGLSMGGNAALVYAFKYPELFDSCAAMGAAIGDLDNPDIAPPGSGLGAILSEKYETESDSEPNESVRLFIDCGDRDRFIASNRNLHKKFKEWSVPHDYIEREGGHDWNYWKSSLPLVLRFAFPKD